MKIKDMDIVSYLDNDLFNIFKYKGIETDYDIINNTKLYEYDEPVRHTGLQYLGLREMILYRYYNIPKDNSKYLNNKIIFRNDGYPSMIENQDVIMTSPNYKDFVPIYSVLLRLGFNFGETAGLCAIMKTLGYSKLEFVDLEQVFNDIIVNNISYMNKPYRTDEKMLRKRVELVLNSNNEAKKRENHINK